MEPECIRSVRPEAQISHVRAHEHYAQYACSELSRREVLEGAKAQALAKEDVAPISGFMLSPVVSASRI